MISSTSSTSGSGSTNARLTSTSERNRSRREASRLATAWIGQPARDSATPSAVPTAPAPTIPMTGGLARSGLLVRVRVTGLAMRLVGSAGGRWRRMEVDPRRVEVGLASCGRARIVARQVAPGSHVD